MLTSIIASEPGWAVRKTSSDRMRRDTFRISCQSLGSLSDGFRQGLLSLTYGSNRNHESGNGKSYGQPLNEERIRG